MEATLTRAEVSHACSLVLSLPQHGAFFSRAFATRFSSASRKQSSVTAKTRAPCTPARGQKYRARPLCHCSIASSVLSTNQSLDFRLSVGSAIVPHPAKVEKGGEDAFFVSNHNGGTLGIADGVSGWAEENIDPALFSRELMEHAVTALGDDLIDNCPRQLLAKASEATSAIGAATAIVAILEREGGVLHVASLGDCGLRLVRKGRIVFATSTQEHYFDCPYQLSSEPGAQTSVDAMVYKVEVLPGDIIIMGSDGLFDNVYDKDIEKTISFLRGSDDNLPQKIASALATLASKHSKDSKYESPYSKEAISQGYDVPLWKKILGQKLKGGKLDDITVLTARVVVTPSLPKVQPVVSSEDDTSVPPVKANVGAPSLPKVETVVAREDDTSVPSVQERTNGDTPATLPEVEPVFSSEGDTSVEPVVSRDADTSLSSAQETTNVDTPPSLPEVETVVSSEVDPSVPSAQKATNVDTPPSLLPTAEPVVAREGNSSLPPAQETTNADTPSSLPPKEEPVVSSEGDTSLPAPAQETTNVGTPTSVEPVVASEEEPVVASEELLPAEDKTSTDTTTNQVLAPSA